MAELIEVVRIGITGNRPTTPLVREVIDDATREVTQFELDHARITMDARIKFVVGGREYVEIKRAYLLGVGWYVKMEDLL